jgi:PDZ domain-containing protein
VRQTFPLPLLLSLLLLGALLAAQPSGYYVIRPGGTYEIGPRLRLPDEHREEIGRLAFTAVLTGPGTWADVISARLSRVAEVVPESHVRPPGVSQGELNELNRRLIDESKPVAAVVALQAAGHPATITGEGAEVIQTLPEMPAAEVLSPGDVIVAVDGQPTETATAAVEAIRRHAVGDTAQLLDRAGPPTDRRLHQHPRLYHLPTLPGGDRH